MASSRFALEVSLRVGALFATLAALAWLLAATGLRAVPVLLGAVAALQVWLLVRVVQRTNRELGRLLGALRFDDVGPSFSVGRLGAGFGELQGAIDEVMERFRESRLEREAQRRYLEALVEHVPVAILTLKDDGRVGLENGAARRLLDATGWTTLDGLVAYGAVFQRDLAQCKPGDRLVTRIEIDGVKRQLVLSATRLVVSGAPVRVVTLEDIQSELDWNELSAWQDMARVLSHEIMNSLTPISSLARTAEELVDELAPGGEAAADLRAAVHTVARRSDGLMRFVSSYREITHLPPPSPRPIALPDYFRRLARLLMPEWQRRGIALHVGTPPVGLAIVADEALLDQAMINLLRNAADAAAAGTQPQVWLDARLSERGRPIIEIADNGPGLEAALEDKIFLPFFTTKPEGSGIGLALARQVMLVHKGAITTGERPGGGAVFRLTF
jgi:two-component system, NtrC family, nitrogen regulation sensor histidine kinase NtrY